MQVYIDLENLLKEKNISKNKVCEACKLQRTQLNNYCKNKVSRIDLTILAKLSELQEILQKKILSKGLQEEIRQEPETETDLDWRS